MATKPTVANTPMAATITIPSWVKNQSMLKLRKASRQGRVHLGPTEALSRDPTGPRRGFRLWCQGPVPMYLD